MYEEYLTFHVYPTPRGNVRGLGYCYFYNENTMCSIDANYYIDTKMIVIQNILKATTPSYESQGFSHLGTRLFVDMLMDMEYRQQLPVEKIRGTISCAERKNNWKTSIPFYAALPKYINKKLPYQVSFALFDKEENILWEGEENIKPYLENIIENNKDDLFFEYKKKWL